MSWNGSQRSRGSKDSSAGVFKIKIVGDTRAGSMGRVEVGEGGGTGWGGVEGRGENADNCN